jgi:uncharacterized membrane protein
VNIFRLIRVLTLVIWLGSIIFFSFVVAPAVFRVLTPIDGGIHVAGDIVNRSLSSLHWMGLCCGLLFLLASVTLHKTLRRAEIVLMIVMLFVTATSQFGIMPRMERLRTDPGVETRTEFDRLHRLSVFAEGTVLLLGLGVVWLVAGNRSNRPYRS